MQQEFNNASHVTKQLLSPKILKKEQQQFFNKRKNFLVKVQFKICNQRKINSTK